MFCVLFTIKNCKKMVIKSIEMLTLTLTCLASIQMALVFFEMLGGELGSVSAEEKCVSNVVCS